MNFRLRTLPSSLRLAVTIFVMAVSTGYFFALLNIYIHYSKADGKAGLTADDVIITFYGPDDKQALIEAKITKGSMKDFVPDDITRGRLVAWVREGYPRDQYEAPDGIGKIFDDNCVGCHGIRKDGSRGVMAFVPLFPYDELIGKSEFVLKPTRGKSLNELVQSSHTHLISMSMMFFLLGALFCCTGAPRWLKGLIVPLPFLGVLLDVGGWWLTKYIAVFAYPMMFGGFLMGVSFAVFSLGIFGECWFAKDPTATAAQLSSEYQRTRPT